MNKQPLMFLKELYSLFDRYGICKVSINRDFEAIFQGELGIIFFEEYDNGAFKSTQIIDGSTLKGIKLIKDYGDMDIVEIENELNREDGLYE